MTLLSSFSNRYNKLIRDKAISRARTRIVIAGRNPDEFSESDLEIVVKEEEDKLQGELKEKSLFAALALLGFNFFI